MEAQEKLLSLIMTVTVTSIHQAMLEHILKNHPNAP